jgi:hypothetical protein
MECPSLASVIGEADVEISLHLTAEGMQAEISETINNTSVRETQTWAEMFPEN